MTHRTYLPKRLMLFGADLPDDFPDRIELLRQKTGLSREAFAHCLNVDPRQLRKWMKGSRPGPDGLFALFTMAERLPDGLPLLLHGNLKSKSVQGRFRL